MQTASFEHGNEVDFHVFVDGGNSRGAEFGVSIEGGEFVSYLIDTQRAWVALPLPDPYPGTIAQAGVDCYPSPVHLGVIRVRPDEPGGRVNLLITPSERNAQAVVLNCDYTASYGFRAYPASINGEPKRSHRVRGDSPATVVDADPDDAVSEDEGDDSSPDDEPDVSPD